MREEQRESEQRECKTGDRRVDGLNVQKIDRHIDKERTELEAGDGMADKSQAKTAKQMKVAMERARREDERLNDKMNRVRRRFITK